MVEILYTNRLILRPFSERDIDSAYEMNLDSEVSRYTGDGGIVSRAETGRRIIEDVMGDYKKYGYGRLAVEVKNGPSFIGFCGLKYLDDFDLVDIGFRFMQAYWGKGYATESARACMEYGFKNLELTKIVGFVLPENNRSINVLRKLGMTFEKSFVEDEELVHQYSILR